MAAAEAAREELRAPPPSGKLRLGSTGDMAEILPGFLWIGNMASSRRSQLTRQGNPITHIVNATADISNELRDLVMESGFDQRREKYIYEMDPEASLWQLPPTVVGAQ